MSTLDRCTAIHDRSGMQCRKAPRHVLNGSPHRWWASQGNPRPEPVEWPIMQAEIAAAVAVPPEAAVQNDAARLAGSSLHAPTRKIADLSVTSCVECPMLCAVTDRCQHPSAGRFGKDIARPANPPPAWCGLRIVQLTLGVAA